MKEKFKLSNIKWGLHCVVSYIIIVIIVIIIFVVAAAVIDVIFIIIVFIFIIIENSRWLHMRNIGSVGYYNLCLWIILIFTQVK
jgi:hypothetical protein